LLNINTLHFFARNTNQMTYKTNDSQYGWTVVEIHRDEAGLYLIEDARGNRYHVPCNLWDSLKGATQRAESHRKSRDYYKDARDSEKKNSSEIHVKMVENHNRVVQDLNHEIAFYQSELNFLEGENRNLKAYLILTGVGLMSSLFYIFI
jgi:hypothetical protein